MPQIFHGRDNEVKDVVDTLLQDGSRVAILGPGGIGKTSLARAVVNHACVVEKFQQRYWVSCESAPSVGDLVSSVALALGMEIYGGGISNAIIQTLTATGTCLLVLDNLETPWEARETRSQVEGFLALVADIPHVSLLITMRGQERPLNVRWTRPFLPPLAPVSDIAARQIFSDISDIEDEEDLADVLSLTGNLPLAVTLMASVASVEGCSGTMTRWKTENVSLLSEGCSKESNLEMSLRFSFSSPRMKSNPDVLRLLGLLSILPDGASDDVLSKASTVNHFLLDKLTLLRTSLAYHGTDGRLKSLPPVREFVKKTYGP
ncbi:P-loop containing nucleoside triphosphate hydrolase protein, partial [Mycena leptocephala]